MTSLSERLSEIQAKLSAPKGQYNSFGKYHYRNCEDILTALKPLINGLHVTITDDIVMVGNRIYVKAIASISDGSSSISATAFAREAEDKKGMDASQLTGATSSYARKYALNGLFMIDDNKDADHQTEPTQQTQKRQQTSQRNSQVKLTDNDINWIKAYKANNDVFKDYPDMPEEYKAFIIQQSKSN